MKYLRKYKSNERGRDFFVTDIHGHFDLLHEEMSRFAFDTSKDRLFVGGDSVDRGPQSNRILDYINEPWFISVRGNHCEMFISAYEDNFQGWSARVLLSNGGQWAFDLFKNKEFDKLKDIYSSFKSLPYAIELDSRGVKVGIVHAEVPGQDWETWYKLDKYSDMEVEHQLAVAVWSRTKYDKNNQEIVKNIDIVLSGHTPTDSGEVESLGNQMFCDAGSFFRHKLNFIEVGNINERN